MPKTKTFVNWSGGKDACMALYHSAQQPHLEICSLLTTISLPYQRITMHGVSKKLLLAQTKALGIPVHILELPSGVDMQTYDQLMKQTLNQFREKGFQLSVFGDIFLEDLKQYREQQFVNSGIELLFPLWQNQTKMLIHDFIELGFKAKIVAANARLIDQEFLGRTLDHQLIATLPEEVDPCGENGEFHTFVYDGPLFENPLDISVGDTVLKKYGKESSQWDNEFWFCELNLNS